MLGIYPFSSILVISGSCMSYQLPNKGTRANSFSLEKLISEHMLLSITKSYLYKNNNNKKPPQTLSFVIEGCDPSPFRAEREESNNPFWFTSSFLPCLINLWGFTLLLTSNLHGIKGPLHSWKTMPVLENIRSPKL